MNITIRSIHIGRPQVLGDPTLGINSGILKHRVDVAELALSSINLDGDDQADRAVHGGIDKAVYAYPSEHLSSWASDLDQPDLDDGDAAPFGENISTVGATEANVCIGDLWRLGDAVLEVCQPRWPCQKLTIYRRTAAVGGLMRSTGRTGWYLRVVQPGTVPTSGSISVERHPAGVTVLQANAAMLDRSLEDREMVAAVANLGDILAAEWRDPLVERLV